MIAVSAAVFGVHHGLTPAGSVELIAGAVALVAASAAALTGSRVVPLSFRRSVPAVLAQTSTNAVTPAGIGGTALMVRLHTRTGMTGPEAASAITARAISGATATALVTAVCMGTDGLNLPAGLPSGLAVVLGVVAALVVFTAITIRVFQPDRVAAISRRVTETMLALGHLARHPRRVALLFAGSVGVVLAQAILLDGAIRAVGHDLRPAVVVAMLLGSHAARAAVPTPGGIGPVEAALVAGLTAGGMPMGTAGLAVVLYRVAGLWVPVAAGVVSLRALRRRGLL